MARRSLARRAVASTEAIRSPLDELVGERADWRARWLEDGLAVHGSLDRLPDALRVLAELGHEGVFATYRGPLAFGRGAKSAYPLEGAAGRDAAALFAMGLTVHLIEPEAQLPGAADWLRAVERDLGAAPRSARLAIFASPAGDGLPWHFDGEDVISIQLCGTKRFDHARVESLRFPVTEQFGPGMRADERLFLQCDEGFPEPPRRFTSTTMAPGSVLLLPRGHWHRSEAASDSLSVSIVLRPPTASRYVLDALERSMLGHEAWRRPLYGPPGTQGAALASLARSLDELVNGLDLARAELRHASTHDVAGGDARWQARPDSRLSIVHERCRIEVSALDPSGRRHVTLSREVGRGLLPALAWLASRRAAFTFALFVDAVRPLQSADAQRLLVGLEEARYLQSIAPTMDPRPAPVGEKAAARANE